MTPKNHKTAKRNHQNNHVNRPNRSQNTSSPLPTIIVTGKHMRDISSHALGALSAANNPPSVFVRAGELCRLRHDEKGRPIIESYRRESLRGRLDRVADFKKITLSGRTPTPPPTNVVDDIIGLGTWSFPAIAGIVEIPVLRPNGTILDKPGYDAATSLYYAPGKGFNVPTIPIKPTPTDIHAALQLLDEAIGDFPFSDQSSKANTIALLLTPIVRPAINGNVPLAAIDAPQQGTGKTLLAKVCSITATGRPAAMMSAPRTEEEWKKSITSTLMSGATVITIDNLDGPLASPNLASALTSDYWRDRVLGKTENVEIAQRATWMATGNNIRFRGDMQRRCYWIRLDAKSAMPWMNRKFKHPKLQQWMKQHRHRLVAALLTLARAWFANGKPKSSVQPIGGFEEWSEVVGGILEFAGVKDFLGNLRPLYAKADEETEEWVEFLIALQRKYGASFTTADIVRELGNNDIVLGAALPSEIADYWGKRNQAGFDFNRRLGKALSSRADRRYGDLEHRLEPAGKLHGAAQWRVVDNAPSQQGEPTNVAA